MVRELSSGELKEGWGEKKGGREGWGIEEMKEEKSSERKKVGEIENDPEAQGR
jgi:hypothetical protein